VGAEFFHAEGRKHATKPTVLFRDFANTHEKALLSVSLKSGRGEWAIEPICEAHDSTTQPLEASWFLARSKMYCLLAAATPSRGAIRLVPRQTPTRLTNSSESTGHSIMTFAV
jgi:hypothetical protein